MNEGEVNNPDQLLELKTSQLSSLENELLVTTVSLINFFSASIVRIESLIQTYPESESFLQELGNYYRSKINSLEKYHAASEGIHKLTTEEKRANLDLYIALLAPQLEAVKKIAERSNSLINRLSSRAQESLKEKPVN